MTYQEISAVLALVFLGLAYIPYCWGMMRGTIKPHVFSWLIWGILTGVVAAAQLSEGGGLGAWIAVLDAVIPLGIAVFAFKKDTVVITRGDWIAFISALLILPLWLITSNPLYAVILASTIDVLIFYPTARKSWHQPHEEGLGLFIVAIFKLCFMLLSLSVHNLVTVLYPLALMTANVLFISMLLWRRRVVAPPSKQL
jgi:uncharacterized protein with PQ loop repeat